LPGISGRQNGSIKEVIMEPQKVDPFTGFLNFMPMFIESLKDPEGAFKRNRATATTTKLHNDTIVVDTCLPADTNLYETGITRTNIEGKWVIVEQYPNKEEALIGHNTWVKLMAEYPDFPLKDIDTWSLDELKEASNGLD
jgi:hypothetical protein